jgi:prolyl-tRNA editing enzyme YbaK/EbsC (Cys-tRNA(Pro) deacylase)
MSLQSVRNFLAERAPDIEIVELDRSSETKTIATAWNVKPAQIAKTLSLCVGERNVLLVTCGNSRLDNKKIKAVLGVKATMLPPNQAAAITGHPVGGACPCGLATALPIYCDVLLKNFDIVVPGAGSTHSAMRIDPCAWPHLQRQNGSMFARTRVEKASLRLKFET